MAFWLETYQTLAVGIVGFVGVIVTILFNAKISRDQRRDERDHERNTLRVALIAELKINRRSLRENADTLKEASSDTEDAFVPTDPMDDVYRAFVPRIGLLSQDEVGKVMDAYLTLEEFYSKLFLLGVPVSTSPGHVSVPSTNLQFLARMQESVLGPIDEAIGALEKSRRIA